MKIITNANLTLRFGLALALALIFSTPLPLRAADAADQADKQRPAMEGIEKMKEHHDKMIAERKAQDAELTEMVAKMNSAAADKKLDLMAAVVTRLVEQRTATHVRMEEMQKEMGKRIMEHMRMHKEGACDDMKGAETEPENAHHKHHASEK